MKSNSVFYAHDYTVIHIPVLILHVKSYTINKPLLFLKGLQKIWV